MPKSNVNSQAGYLWKALYINEVITIIVLDRIRVLPSLC